MDTFKVRKGLYQFTAIDDCTRLRALKLYPDRSALSSLAFLEYACKTLPFPPQRIQTDRGQEFFAYEFQEQLMRLHIKFRPIRPHSPHLNGKVERSQMCGVVCEVIVRMDKAPCDCPRRAGIGPTGRYLRRRLGGRSRRRTLGRG